MADETEVIRKQMEETRTSMSEKLGALEEQVTSTVKGTAESVTETAQSVSQTVQSVTQLFDLSGHVERYPWAMVGAGVALGYTLGCLTTPSRESSHADWRSLRSDGSPPSGWAPSWSGFSGQPSTQSSAATSSSLASGMSSASPSASSFGGTSEAACPTTGQPSMLGDTLKSVMDTFGPMADQLKGLAIGTASGVVGEMLVKALPESLREGVSQMVDEFTRSLGGQVLRRQDQQAEDGHGQAHQGGQDRGQAHDRDHGQGHDRGQERGHKQDQGPRART